MPKGLEEAARSHRFSTGDLLEDRRHEVPPFLRLTAPFEKPDWKARQPGGTVHPPFAGTPIHYQEEFFEVLQIEPAARGEGVVYTLTPWDDRELLRAPRTLDESSLSAAAETHRESQRPAPPFFLLPFFGALPAEDQQRLETDRGILANPATLGSALAGLALGIPASAASLLMLFDPGFAATLPNLSWLRWTALLWLYLFVESLFRLVVVLALERPLGSLPLVLAIGVPRALRRDLAAQRQHRLDHLDAPMDALQLLHARDRVRSVAATQESSHRLEIVSLLPKPDWILGHTPIHFEGTHYLLVERHETGVGNNRRHRFHLEPIQSSTLSRAPLRFDVEDTARRAREIVRQRRSPWVEPLGYLWGFLPIANQRQLEAAFGYDPIAYTRLNLFITLIFALPLAVVAFVRFAGGGDLFDVGVLSLALYLCVESAHRKRRLRAGQVEGSILGHLMRPLAERLVRGLA